MNSVSDRNATVSIGKGPMDGYDDGTAERLVGLRKLAGGVAHDFNNLLTVILGNANLMMLDLPAESPFIQNLEDIISAAERAANLAEQMLVFAGKRQPDLQAVDLNLVLSEAVRQAEAQIPERIRLTVSPHPDLPAVWGDAGHLRQLVFNLLNNAIEAMVKREGRILVQTRPVLLAEADRPRLRLAASDWQPGPRIALTIADEGAGMEAEILTRIFDPFFTTKFMGRGMGMSVVQGIVEAHHGQLEIDSRPGHGTRIHVYLPLA